MANRLPLAGITVVELGQNVAAPYAGEILGDLGADIVKIEKIDGGDDARQWAPPFWHGVSAIFQSLNRNKRSAAVNLRNPQENARLREFIIERADVVIQNLRPGALAALGLDAESLRARKPSLIYCAIGAFGASGPFKDRPGYDPLMQAFAGLMSVTGEPGRAPVRVGTSIIDMAAGMWSVIGVLAALMRRRETGEGTVVETSLFETALAWMIYHAANYQASGQLPQRQGSGVAQIVPYRGFTTKDGFIVIAAGSDKLFARLAQVLGHREWSDDPRFRTNPDRVKNQTVLYGLIDPLVAGWTTETLQRALDAAGVPSTPMHTIDQVLAHPQTQALGMLQPSPDGKITLLGLPLSFDGVRPAFRSPPPGLGAHTEEVLGSMGDGHSGARPA
jgi:crotonobetainyl-CoA:carnitine CoA-transferase CaiB-like acyl-CoA transferase